MLTELAEAEEQEFRWLLATSSVEAEIAIARYEALQSAAARQKMTDKFMSKLAAEKAARAN